MTKNNHPWQSYRKVATQTATPGHLVLMLFEGSIGFLERSLEGFKEPELAQRNSTISNNIIKAQAIIRELNCRLDMQRGGEVAKNFRRLYDYFHRRLQDANLSKSPQPVEETISFLRVLRDSWAEMLQRGPENPRSDYAMPAIPESLDRAAA